MLIYFSIFSRERLNLYQYLKEGTSLLNYDPKIFSGLTTALISFSEKVEQSVQKIQFSNMLFYLKHYGDFSIQLLFEENRREESLEIIFSQLAKKIIQLIEKNVETAEYERVLLPILSKFIEDPLIGTRFTNLPLPQSSLKIALVGLGNAGKTTLKNMFFEKWTNEMAKNVVPTIGVEILPKYLEFIKQNIFILDYGGQKAFRESYLEDFSKWRGLSIVIFLIDIQVKETIKESLSFLSNIWKIIKKEHKKPPKMAIFFHKVDMEDKHKLADNIGYAMNLCKEFSQFASFHLSSIYDNSGYIAMIKTLYFSLPDVLLKLLLEDKFLDYYQNEVLNQFASFIEEENCEEIFLEVKTKIKQNLINQGYKFSYLMQEEWLRYLIGDWSPKPKAMKAKQLFLEQKGQNYYLILPKYEERGFPSVLTTILYEGLLEGVLQTFHLNPPKLFSENKETTTWEIQL